MDKFIEVTETSKSFVSKEQIQRMENRYSWASSLSKSKDVIEIACGTGQGLSLIQNSARSVKACDISKKMINTAKETYSEESIEFQVSDALSLPYKNNSADIIILFEAIYYLKNISQFMHEVKRVLRPNGELLISTANSDLYDFNPSPYSINYYGAKDLYDLLAENNYKVELFADLSLKNITIKQKLFRLIKYLSVRLNLMPKTMKGKKIFKNIVYGDLVKMPKILKIDNSNLNSYNKIIPEPNYDYKVILARAILKL